MASSSASESTALPNALPGPEILDDKSIHCIPFILSHLANHTSSHQSSSTPFFIALNGIQGAGKTTLVTTLHQTLSSPPHSLSVLVLSIDDLYLPHSDQLRLAAEHASNKLVQHRGEPGTHDVRLMRELVSALTEGREYAVPEYDKSAFNGAGDRVPASRWKIVNRPGERAIQVVIFEGWCVGFSSLPPSAIEAAYYAPSLTLQSHSLSDLLFVNSRLAEYEILNGVFDAFIHIDAEETGFVYAWRQEQEAALRRDKGRGMSEEQVKEFVDGYYPAYELYTGALRRGVFHGREDMKGKQLRLIVGKDRKVKEVIKI